MEQKCYGIRNIASFPAACYPSCQVVMSHLPHAVLYRDNNRLLRDYNSDCVLLWCEHTQWLACNHAYAFNAREFYARLGYRRAKCPAVALWWIIHELNCSICGLIIFTVVTDQHSAAISVQAVDDVGYSLGFVKAAQTCTPLTYEWSPQP